MTLESAASTAGSRARRARKRMTPLNSREQLYAILPSSNSGRSKRGEVRWDRAVAHSYQSSSNDEPSVPQDKQPTCRPSIPPLQTKKREAGNGRVTSLSKRSFAPREQVASC